MVSATLGCWRQFTVHLMLDVVQGLTGLQNLDQKFVFLDNSTTPENISGFPL
jgi:hypothetical protein